ncbi:MAG: outer membrane beta-barrel protein [Proteobacteria bacterium]|nr:outer membrane beta-barrel protein [Pseudomonadota bacterium]
MKKLILLVLIMVSANLLAVEKGDWLLHLRAINIMPNDDSSMIRVAGTGVAGTGVGVDSGLSLDISVAYMVSDNWAVEVLANLSSKHNVSANGLAGLGVPNGTDVVDTNVLPPTVFLQYQFKPKATIRPYAGLGVNYTLFFNEDLTTAAETVLGASNLDMDSSFGLAAQFGVDFDMKNDWFFSADLKYIQIDTTANFDSSIGNVSVDVDINPWIIGFGFGRTF